jgi:hypothetical protein
MNNTEMFKTQLSVIGGIIENQIKEMNSIIEADNVNLFNFRYFYLSGSVNTVYRLAESYSEEEDFLKYLNDEIYKTYVSYEYPQCFKEYQNMLKTLLEEILEKLDAINWKIDIEYCENNFLI